MSAAMGPSLGIGLGFSQSIDPSMQEPERDEKKFASLVDLIARVSKTELVNHILNLSLLEKINEAGITYVEKKKLYYLDNEKLADNYFHLCRYICSPVDARKVDIRFLASLEKPELEKVIGEFAEEKGIKLDIEEKKLTRGRAKYLSVSKDGDEIARVFQAKVSFVHDRLKLNPESYQIGLELTARIAAEVHRNKFYHNTDRISYSKFMGPLYLAIPDWFKKDYVADVVSSINRFLDSKNPEVLLPNPVAEGRVAAKDMIKEASKKPGCFYVADEYKKRHIDYIFADEKGKVTLKLEANIDLVAVKMAIAQPVMMKIGGNWMPSEDVSLGTRRLFGPNNHPKTETLDGNHLLVGTIYSSRNLELKGKKLYEVGAKKPLITFGDRTVNLRPKSGYSSAEYRMAVAAANAIYEQMLYSTDSTISRKGTTACMRQDELEVIKDVLAIAKRLHEEDRHRYSQPQGIRIACDRYIAAAKKQLEKQILKQYGLEGDKK